MARKVLNVRKYKAGYEIRTERLTGDDNPGMAADEELITKSAYTPSGDYIGRSRDAYNLCYKRGIAPEKRTKANSACSIGFCEREHKWYGWSHRAIFGFGIGDKIFDEDYGDESTPFNLHGARTITVLPEAKQAARNFAKYVS
ncbi:hypothetical protein LCGC14_0845330 [marine sediment metagenome]|uniref:Uncharacterized protein n=1 Tax=marine sediment metagenome TaxID=412755 RepID=A0A0F9SJ20_9ZZZZ